VRTLKLTEELLENLKSEMDSGKVEMNPNCFFDLPGDAQSEELAADEEAARSMAIFLWDVILPSITECVREGEVVVLENAQMVNVLHSHGVNMRYLGRMATLARSQEETDEQLRLTNKVRMHPMPSYWLEMLETEMLARSMKLIINGTFAKSARYKRAPAKFIALYLNCLLGGEDIYCGLCPPAGLPSASENAPSTQGKKKKASKKSSSSSSAKVLGSEPLPTSGGSVPTPAAPATSREDFWNELKSVLSNRFCYNVDNVRHQSINLVTDGTAAVSTQNNVNCFLTSRINKVTLLRRICQLCGIR